MKRTVIGRHTGWPYDSDPRFPFDFALDQQVADVLVSRRNLRDSDGKYREGGEFRLRKAGHLYVPSSPLRVTAGGKLLYAGSMVGAAPELPERPAPENLIGLGPEALRTADPTQALFEGANALYELKDLGDMLQAKSYSLSQARDLGNLSLQLNFGWVPFLQDLKSFSQAQEKMEQRIETILRNAGKPVRRKFDLKSYGIEDEQEVSKGTSQFPNAYPLFVTQAYSGPTQWRVLRRTYQRVWFSGRARYQLPTKLGVDVSAKRKYLKRALYGFTVTPRRLYKAIPWTWMLDWIGNVSDNLYNLAPGLAERLTWDYAYLMRTVEEELILEQKFKVNSFDGVQDVVVRTSARHTLKERVYAYPFAARFTSRGVSPFQANILGSLAVSRLPGRKRG